MVDTLDLPFTILLEPDAHRYASQFAAEQVSPPKGKQVYLNTLAVYAVNTYLNWLAIDTVLHRSDCWHVGLRSVLDVADLMLPDAGRLECRPILPGENELVIPISAPPCLGYVAVELDHNLQHANLLGFIPANGLREGTEQIALNQLTSLDAMIDTIHQAKRTVKLNLWLEQIFQQDWQLPSQVLSTAFRGSPLVDVAPDHIDSGNVDPTNVDPSSTPPPIRRGKLVTVDPDQPPVALVLELMGGSTETCDLRLRVFPTGQATKLPQGLEISLLDEDGTPCATAMSHSDSDWIELEFTVTAGEQFCLQLVMDEHQVNERFEF